MQKINPIRLSGFKGVVDSVASQLISMSEASDNRNVWTDEYEGMLSKTKGFYKVGNLGSVLSVNTCETAWTAKDADTTCSASSVHIQGSYSACMAISAGESTGLVATQDFTAMDLSGYTKLGFYVMSTVVLAAGDMRIAISATAACGGTPIYFDIPALVASRWEYVTVTLSGTRTAIISIGLDMVTDKTCSVYLDSIEAISTSAFPIDTCETAWTSHDLTNITTTADATIYKVGTYSSKNVIATDFTTGLISTHVIVSMNLSQYNRVGFWLYSTIALEAGDLSLCLDNTAACASPLEQMTINKDIPAATWTYCTVRLAAASSDTAIISVGLYANRDFGACTVYIDDIRAYKPVKAIYEYQEADGSVSQLARDNNNVWVSTDNGINWGSIAGGLTSTYDTSFATYDGDCWFGDGNSYNMIYDSTAKTIVLAGASGASYYMPKGRVLWTHQGIYIMIGAAGGELSTVQWNDTAVATSDFKTLGTINLFPSSTTTSHDIESDTGDYITGALPYGNVSVITLNRRFAVLYGSSMGSFDFQVRNLGIGCTLGKSLQIKDGKVVFANEKGLYVMDENFTPERISDKNVKKFFDSLAQPIVVNNIWTQTLQSDFEAGTIGAYTIATTDAQGGLEGTVRPRFMTSKTDWELGTRRNINTTTTEGDITITTPYHYGALTAIDSEFPLTGITQKLAMSFTNGTAITYLKRASARLRKASETTGTITVTIETNSSSLPSGTAVTNGTATLDIATYVGTSFDWEEFVFTLPVELDASTTYWIVIKSTDISGTLYIAQDSSGVSYTAQQYYNGSTWANDYHYYPHFAVLLDSYLITQTLDYGSTPDKAKSVTANVTVPTGCSIEFKYQTLAADTGWATVYADFTSLGSTSAGATNFSGSIATSLRYVRIFIWLKSDLSGATSPSVHNLTVGGVAISQTHDTGGSITKWNTLQVEQTLQNQNTYIYIRSATTEGGLSTATWVLYYPGDDIRETLANQWVQWKAELNTDNYNEIPFIDSITLNWITGSGSTLPSTQVASCVNNSRYYLFAQKLTEEYNNVAICIDKSWNFQFLEDYPIGSCTQYKVADTYAGSSFNGMIFKMFDGYTFNYIDWVDDIESYWTTGRLGIEHAGQDALYNEIMAFFETVPDGDLYIYYDIENTGIFTIVSATAIDLTDANGENRYLFSGIIQGRDIKLKFLVSGTSVDWKLMQFLVNRSVYPRTY